MDECDEYVDLKIAEHIVNLHKQGGETLMEQFRPHLTQNQFMLYLKFAKKTKPKFTKEAAEFLRDEYRNLRQSDISYQKTAYRITVRQLESLIRLSEALARVHLDEYIYPEYVREASRLLKQSIIRVEMPDVEIYTFGTNLEEQRRKHRENNEDVVTL